MSSVKGATISSVIKKFPLIMTETSSTDEAAMVILFMLQSAVGARINMVTLSKHFTAEVGAIIAKHCVLKNYKDRSERVEGDPGFNQTECGLIGNLLIHFNQLKGDEAVETFRNQLKGNSIWDESVDWEKTAFKDDRLEVMIDHVRTWVPDDLEWNAASTVFSISADITAALGCNDEADWTPPKRVDANDLPQAVNRNENDDGKGRNSKKRKTA